MSSKRNTGGVQRHRSPDEADRAGRWRAIAGGAIVVTVLGVGVLLAFGDFLGRPEAGSSSATPVRMSMAGFDPPIIMAKADSDLELELWTTDAAVHLQGGVHTVISEQLGIYEELPAESRRTVTLRMPTAPGDYDIYCNTCCGGKESPSMHGILRVVA
jgi:cytochrome c oxidase subunit 2